MRATVNLEPDVAAAVEALCRREHVSMSAAVNRLIRASLAAAMPSPPFEQSTSRMGLQINVADVAEALELLEGRASR